MGGGKSGERLGFVLGELVSLREIETVAIVVALMLLSCEVSLSPFEFVREELGLNDLVVVDFWRVGWFVEPILFVEIRTEVSDRGKVGDVNVRGYLCVPGHQ